jgi:dienelactone hydrolase
MRIFIAAMASLLLSFAASRAEPFDTLAGGQSGAIEFLSPTPTGPSSLIKRLYGADRARIVGALTLPPGNARVPAMVISHGSGGILAGREHEWAARLNRLGIASFVIDSFAPRGIRNTAADQTRLSTMANVADALTALKLLASHPRIDPARIGIIGFSRGGQVALYTALVPIRRGVIDGELRFAAHIALYPSCNIPYHASEVSPAPLLMLLGEADDYTPAPPCLAYAEWFRGRGARIQTRTYPGAYHDFDVPQPPRRYASLQTARSCRAEVSVGTGTMRRLDTGEEMTDQSVINAYLKTCMEYGATYGGNQAALAQAERDVAAFLNDIFRLGR